MLLCNAKVMYVKKWIIFIYQKKYFLIGTTDSEPYVYITRFKLKNISGHTHLATEELYCYHSMRAFCMERLELLDHLREELIGRLSSDIASNNTNENLLDVENRVQDETSISISGKITEIIQRFPNYQEGHQQKKAYHLQLKSKYPTQSGSSYLETFQCYDIGRAESILETLVYDNGCWVAKFGWQKEVPLWIHKKAK